MLFKPNNFNQLSQKVLEFVMLYRVEKQTDSTYLLQPLATSQPRPAKTAGMEIKTNPLRAVTWRLNLSTQREIVISGPLVHTNHYET